MDRQWTNGSEQLNMVKIVKGSRDKDDPIERKIKTKPEGRNKKMMNQWGVK